jgi:tetratricopeptide (TPR) repeat protein
MSYRGRRQREVLEKAVQASTALRLLLVAVALAWLPGHTLEAAAPDAPVAINPSASGLYGRLAAGAPAVDRIFARWDTSGDGTLQPAEWLRYVRDSSALPIDADEDGLISRQEFLASFLGLNQSRAILYEHYSLHLLWEGKVLAEKGDWEKALAHYRQVMQVVPESLESFMGQGRCLLQLGRWEQARQAFRQAADHAPSYAEAWLELSLAEFALKEPLEGLKHLKRAVKILETASRLRLPGSEQASEAAYTGALLQAAARRLAVAGYARESNDLLEQAGRMPAPAATAEAPASCDCEPGRLMRLGRPAEAHVEAERFLTAKPEEPEGHLVKASLEADAGRIDEAASCLKRARDLGASGGSLLALELGSSLDRNDEVGMRKLLWKLDPEEFTQTEALDLGWQLASRSRWGLARAWFRRAWMVPIDQQRTRLLMALCCLNMEDKAGAIRLMDGFMAPVLSGTPLLRLAVALYLKLGLGLQAQQLAEEAVWQQPQDLANRLLLAEVYAARGDPDGRANVLRQALAVSPAGLPQTERLAALVRSLGPAPASTAAGDLAPEADPEAGSGGR